MRAYHDLTPQGQTRRLHRLAQAALVNYGLPQTRLKLLFQEVVEGKTYWFAPVEPAPKTAAPLAHLLPAYDEYILYKDHSAVLDPQYLHQVIAGNGIVIILDGRMVGVWKHTFRKGAAVVTLNPFRPLAEAEKEAVTRAAYHYGAFLEMPVVLEWV